MIVGKAAAIFYFLTFKLVIASFLFDLSALEQDSEGIQVPNITDSTEAPARFIGTKRPSETVLINAEKAPRIITNPFGSSLSFGSFTPALISRPLIEKTKTPRKRTSFFDAKLKPLEIIENELKTGIKLNGEIRVDVLKRTLLLISENDLDALTAHQTVFKDTFNKKYSSYVKNGIDNYLFIFVLLFGSHDLSDLINPKHQFYTEIIDILPDILRYLFKTKPFRVSMTTVLKLCDSRIKKELKDELIEIVNTRFPNLDYFERFLLNFIGASNSRGMENVFKKKSEVEKLVQLSLAVHRCDQDLLIHFQRLPLERPDLYRNPQVDNSTKARILESVFANDNVEILPQVLDIYPDISLYNLTAEDSSILFNVFRSTAQYKAYKCFEFFLELLPEMLEGDGNGTRSCPIRLAIHSSRTESKLIEILNEKGVDYKRKLKKDGVDEPMNLLQYAFHSGCSAAFSYYYTKAGVQNARADLYKLFKNDNELIRYSLSYVSDAVTKQIASDFGIDLNARNFNYQNRTGNVSIFFDRWERERRAIYFNIDLPEQNF